MFRVWGLGFGVWGLGLGVGGWGLGVGGWGSGFRVSGSGFRAYGVRGLGEVRFFSNFKSLGLRFQNFFGVA